MQFMLLHTLDENLKLDGSKALALESTLVEWIEEVHRLEVNVQGSRLRPTSDATTVRIRAGELVVTDGPFAESKEQIVGYDVLNCSDIDEALGWAAKHPTARTGSIEVRPLIEDSPPTVLPEQRAQTIRYMLIVCVDESVQLSPDEAQEMGPATDAWVHAGEQKSTRLFGSRLDSVGTAKTLRISNDQVLISDGPFADTKEQVAGFDVLECADLDEALAIAALHPVARIGALEVRPFWPFDGTSPTVRIV